MDLNRLPNSVEYEAKYWRQAFDQRHGDDIRDEALGPPRYSVRSLSLCVCVCVCVWTHKTANTAVHPTAPNICNILTLSKYAHSPTLNS